MIMTNIRGKKNPYPIKMPFDDIDVLKCNHCKECLFEDLCKEYGEDIADNTERTLENDYIYGQLYTSD